MIEITKITSEHDVCNGCNDNDGKLTQIRIGVMSVRVCEKCAKTLASFLTLRYGNGEIKKHEIKKNSP